MCLLPSCVAVTLTLTLTLTLTVNLTWTHVLCVFGMLVFNFGIALLRTL